MFSQFDIQKLKSLPIEDVAHRLNIDVSRHKALCPFHDDSRPSLTFNVRSNCFRCYVCDSKGSTVDLVMKSQHWGFYESCKWLAKEYGVTTSEDLSCFEAGTVATRTPHTTARCTLRTPRSAPIDVRHLENLINEPNLCEEARRFLFDERKISPCVVQQLGISSISRPTPMSGNPNDMWFNAPSLLIPYRDINGTLTSVQARYLGPSYKGDDGVEHPRFQFPRGSTSHIFNLPILNTLTDADELWITEGVTDCLAMMSSGRKAIAIPSATLLKPKDVQLITRPSQDNWRGYLHMSPDNDAPGAKLFHDLQQLLPSLKHHPLPSSFKDFGEYWRSIKR